MFFNPCFCMNQEKSVLNVLSEETVFELKHINYALLLIDQRLKNLRIEISPAKYELIMADAMKRLNLLPLISYEQNLNFIDDFIHEIESVLYLELVEMEF